MHGRYNTHSQIKFKTSMLRSNLCDYSDAYILVNGTITVAALAAGGRNNDIKAVFKNCAPSTDCISEINNTQIDNAKYINVIMSMRDLIEYRVLCVISNAVANLATTFATTDTKLYVPVVALSTQDNTQLVEQLKSGFKRTINWKKYQPKVSTEVQDQYLDILVDPSFHVVNRLFVLLF